MYYSFENKLYEATFSVTVSFAVSLLVCALKEKFSTTCEMSKSSCLVGVMRRIVGLISHYRSESLDNMVLIKDSMTKTQQ